MRCTLMPIPSRLRGFLIGKIIAVMPLVAAWAAAFGMLETRAQTSPPREYQLKAVFLFNFVQFVEWPPTAFPEAGAPIYLGVLGDDPFGPILEQVVRGETIHHRRLVIKRSRQLEDLKACHLLFISRSEEGQLAQILADALANNSTAALAFNDARTAAEILGALKAESHVVAACLYARDGTIFARYSRSAMKQDFPARPGEDGYRFERDHLVLVRPVVLNSKRIGSIYIQADLEEIYERLKMYAGIVLLVLTGSFLVTFALSSGLGLAISQALCQLLGYRMEVRSEVGKGSTFRLILAPLLRELDEAYARAKVRLEEARRSLQP